MESERHCDAEKSSEQEAAFFRLQHFLHNTDIVRSPPSPALPLDPPPTWLLGGTRPLRDALK
jgi:hypothetical protein